MKFYNNNISPNARRARIIAAEAGVKLDRQEIDFAKGENKSPAYLAKNPMGKVPTLEDGNFVLWESPAIGWYLAAQNPSKKLLPTDARGQAETLRWAFWNAAHFERAVFTIGFERIIKPAMNIPVDQNAIDNAQKDVDRYAPVLNAALEGKTYLLGDTLTLADLILAPTVEFGTAAKIDWSRYTHLKQWFARLSERESFKTA